MVSYRVLFALYRCERSDDFSPPIEGSDVRNQNQPGRRPTGNHVIRDRIWKSKKLRMCSLKAALAYPWIFLVADEWGRFEYDAKLVWSEVFGARDDITEDDVSEWLAEYGGVGLLVRYHIDGDLAYWTNFEGRPPTKRRKSNYPHPDGLEESVRKNAPTRQQELEREQELEQETRARALVDAYNSTFGTELEYGPGNLSAAGRALSEGYTFEHCKTVFEAVKSRSTSTAQWCAENNREFDFLLRPPYRHYRTHEITLGPLDKIPNELATGRKQAS